MRDWCELRLNSRPVDVFLRTGHLSRVVGVSLADGRRVVIKARPFSDRLHGCTAVQAHLSQQGFPCPLPLTLVDEIDGNALTAETAVEGGQQRSTAGGAKPFAELLARLVSAAPRPGEIAPLVPSPPWAAWDHAGTHIWPDVDDTGRDLNKSAGPDWIDGAAAAVRSALLSHRGHVRIGHGDWESQNIRWSGDAPYAVHDWDSVVAQPEVTIVGLASAVWAARGRPGQAATVKQSADFIAAYEAAADVRWNSVETQAVWAAGLWVRLFNAKKDAVAGGGAQLDRLAGEVEQRLAHAGVDAR